MVRPVEALSRPLDWAPGSLSLGPVSAASEPPRRSGLLAWGLKRFGAVFFCRRDGVEDGYEPGQDVSTLGVG